RVRGRRRTSESFAEYDLWRSPKRSRLIPASIDSRPGSDLQFIYERHGVGWESPLSIHNFEKLRQSLPDARDEVSGQDLLTLASSPAAGARADIQRIELTVRKSDWHALAQRILLADAEYEITEILEKVIP